MARSGSERLPMLQTKPLVLAANCRPPSRVKCVLRSTLTLDGSMRSSGLETGGSREVSARKSLCFTDLMRDMMLKLQGNSAASETIEIQPQAITVQTVSLQRKVVKRSKIVLNSGRSERPSSVLHSTRPDVVIRVKTRSSQVMQTQFS